MATLAALILALADCLEALEKNPRNLEACIAKYPDHQKELRALLLMVEALNRTPAEAEPRCAFLHDLRFRLTHEPLAKIDARGGESEHNG